MSEFRMRFLAGMAGVTVFLSVVGVAEAASRGTKNRCSDATMEMRGAPQFFAEDHVIEGRAVETTIRHLNQITERHNRAMSQLNSAGSFSEDDPDLEECMSLIKRARTYIGAMTKKIEAAKVLATKGAPVLAAARGTDKQQALFMLAAVQLGAKQNVFNNGTPKQVKGWIDSLAPVEAACKASMPEAIAKAPVVSDAYSSTERRAGGVVMRGDLDQQPDWWCYIAGNRKELTAKALGLFEAVAPGYGVHEAEFQSALNPRPDWDGAASPALYEILGDENRFLAALTEVVKSWYTTLEVPVPAEPFPGLKGRIAEVRAAIEAVAERTPMKSSAYHDRALEGRVKGLLLKNWSKVNVVASWMDAPNWAIKMSPLGMPIERSRSGVMVVRVGSEKYCRVKPFVFTEAHQGGGKYVAGAPPYFPEVIRVVKCP